MYAHLSFVALVLVTFNLVKGQRSDLEWVPETFPNPRSAVDAQDCGLEFQKPGYVCDPNRIFGDEIKTFQWILVDAARNGTRCPCSTYHCEHDGGFEGYRIGLAIVNKMKLQKGRDNQINTPKAQGQLFAYYLQRKWNLGRECEEDIIIFYSVKDKVLSIYGGQTARAKLTPDYIQLLAYKVSGRFQEGKIVEALHNLIFDMKLILNCESTVHDCGVHEMLNSSSRRSLSIGLVFLVSLLAALRSYWH